MKIAIVSGYFALPHVGHFDLFRATKTYAINNKTFVIINNDEQTINKYGFLVTSAKERAELISQNRYVDDTYISIDEDESVAKTIEFIALKYKNIADIFHGGNVEITFYNAGDRTESNANPKEVEVCERLGVKMEYLNLPKRGSSTSLLNDIKKQGVNEYLLGVMQKSLEESIQNRGGDYLKPGDMEYL